MPFFVLMALSYIEPSGRLLFAAIFALLFYYLLLIKDFMLIDRKSAYEFMVLTLAFFLTRDFYQYHGANLITFGSLCYGFLAAALIGILVYNLIENPIRRAAAWFAFILAWQFFILGLFMPLNFVYQSVVIFLIVALIIDFVPEYASGKISREKWLGSGMAIGLLLAIILAAAHWKLGGTGGLLIR